MEAETDAAPPARLFDVHRMSTHDGPGLRTTVFLKGCALRCPWCHNPESINPRSEPWWFAEKCIHCGACEAACPAGAITIQGSLVQIHREMCARCGDCVAACLSGALQMAGYRASVEDVVRIASRDRLLFENSGGGVTISGGEPLLQPEAVTAIAGLLKRQGIHVAVDTCGAVRPDLLDRLLPNVDLVLLDLKLLEPAGATRLLGSAAGRVRTFAVELARGVRGAGSPSVWIRTPIITGATDSVDNVRQIADFIASELAGVVERWELCAFNPLGAQKYRRLGREWEYHDAELTKAHHLKRLRSAAVERLNGAVPVLATGLTAGAEGP